MITNETLTTVEPIIAWVFFPNHEEIRNLGLVIAAFFGLFMLAWRAISQDRSSKAAKANAEIAQENIKLTQANMRNATKSHLAETYSRAIEQLGAVGENKQPIIQTRLGALYALEKIAQADEEYHDPVMQIICAYARTSSPVMFEHDDIEKKDFLPDTQACLEIIGRRNNSFDRGLLNLNYVNFDEQPIGPLNLSNVSFLGSNFRNKLLLDVNFDSALLASVDFTGADLKDSSLQHASLSEAIFKNASLQGVDFRGADNLTVDQIKSVTINKQTKLPDYIKVTWNNDGTYECEMI